MSEYRNSVALPYIGHLISNIKSRFCDADVKLLVSSSVFEPARLPTDEATLSEYGKEQTRPFTEFYGSEATTKFDGKTYSSPPMINGDEIHAEWKLFKRALVRETRGKSLQSHQHCRKSKSKWKV